MIIGGGFGGLNCAQSLKARWEVSHEPIVVVIVVVPLLTFSA
ncbi:MAG: hypothetical protein ACREA2_12915 [Blastocatellia bacterium]